MPTIAPTDPPGRPAAIPLKRQRRYGVTTQLSSLSTTRTRQRKANRQREKWQRRAERHHQLRAREGERQSGPQALLDDLRPIIESASPSVAACGRTIMRCDDGSPGVAPLIKRVSGKVRFAGTFTCKNVRLCPACGERIMAARKHAARTVLAAARAAGDRVLMLTLTQRPMRGPLAESFEQHDTAVAMFMRSLTSMQQQRRAVVTGYISADDITHATGRGWHPHRHVIVIVRTDIDLGKLRKKLIGRWLDCVAAGGGEAIKAGQLLKEVDEEGDGRLIEYVLSASEKRGDDDEHRTIRDLMHLAIDGDRQAAWLLREYAAASKGRRSVTSGGVLRLTHEQPEEVDPETGLCPGDDRILDLTAPALRIIRRRRRFDHIIQQVALAAAGGPARIAAHTAMMAARVPMEHWFIDWSAHRDEFYLSRAYDDHFPEPPALPPPTDAERARNARTWGEADDSHQDWLTERITSSLAADNQFESPVPASPSSTRADEELETAVAKVPAENPTWSRDLAVEFVRAAVPH